MSRYLVVVLMVVVVILVLVSAWLFGRTTVLGDRLDGLLEEQRILEDGVMVRDMELMLRDSLLLEGLRESEVRMLEYVKLRSVSWGKAKGMEDSIMLLQMRRDSLIRELLK